MHRKLLEKLFSKNKVSLTAPKPQLVCMLPYTGKSLLELKARLRGTVETNIPFYKLNIIFRSTYRVGNLFIFKDSLENKNLSGTVNSYICSNCQVTYYGKTFRHCSTRASKDMGTLNLTVNVSKTLKVDNIWPPVATWLPYNFWRFWYFIFWFQEI